MRVAASLEELLTGATDHTPLVSDDSKSGAAIERVTIGGEPFVVKHLHVDGDGIARMTGDLGCRAAVVAARGVLDRMPACIDHAVVAVALGLGRNGNGAALLMEDVGAWLVPQGDHPIDLADHLTFVDHMAALHAAYFAAPEITAVDLVPPGDRYVWFAPEAVAALTDSPLPALILEGWRRFADVGGAAAAAVLDVVAAPWGLGRALAALPATLVHGDWKMGNLGRRPDGRTILIDWAVTGPASPTVDLAWYLSINAARNPQSKDDTIAAYRAAIAAYGVDVAPWWDTALDLALLGACVQFGWEKGLGGPGAELDWWLARVEPGLRRLRALA